MMDRDSIENKILELLDRLDDPAKTICPSEVARALFPEHWRDHMDDVRQAAQHLVDGGKIAVTQKGVELELESASGPVRLRKRR